MNKNISVDEFINSPDTVDFVVRRNEYLTEFINVNPNLLVTKTIAGRYVVVYANKNIFENIIKDYGIN